MSGARAHKRVPAKSRKVSSPVGSDHLARLFEVGSRHHWDRGQFLFSAGDPARSLHLITSGVAAVSRGIADGRRQILVFLFADDVCGLVQSNGRYVFDYEVITAATTRAVDMGHVRRLTSSHTDIAEAVKEKMFRTERRLAEQLVAVGQLNAKERVVHFLGRLSQSYAERDMPTDPLVLPMARRDLADHLGMRLETLSRAFTDLKRQGLIDLQDDYTVVLDGGAFLDAGVEYRAGVD